MMENRDQEQEHIQHAVASPSPDGRPEDVLLDIPQLTVDTIELDVSDLRANVSLAAEVLNLVRLNVGVDATLGKVQLDIRGMQAQALLKVRLDKVAEIVNGVVGTIHAHPEIVEQLVKGAGQPLGEAGRGVGQALPQVGQGAGQAAQQTGQATPGKQAGPGQQQGDQGQQANRGQGERGRFQGPRTWKSDIEASATVEADQWRSRESEQRQQGPEKAQRDEPSSRGGLPHRPPRRW
jgi:hypothetical protein